MAARDEVRVSHEEQWEALRSRLATLHGTCSDTMFSLDHDADYLVAQQLEELHLHIEWVLKHSQAIHEACMARPRA